jgi:UDP-N-acetylglucosamine 2-epimerase (non-hydrolysing)
VDLVAGARPNFIKLAPVEKALRAQGDLRPRIVHTGQHYDTSMSDVFFQQLGIPDPEVHLEVGSGTHGAQTARILERYEQHLLQSRPHATVVFGDVNSTVACALAASKLGIPIVHVEAGLRSGDRRMPEEINRILTDALSDLLLVTEPSGIRHLAEMGIRDEKVVLVGNTMIDTLLEHLPRARALARPAQLGFEPRGYGLLTLHRPANVDDPEVLRGLMATFQALADRLPIVFPVHPRTRRALDALGFEARGDLRLLDPEPYLQNLGLMADARLILTDSGGIQEEAAVLGVPCITLRDTTERPVTLEVGASRLVASDRSLIEASFQDVVEGRWPASARIPLWDGRAGERVAAAICKALAPGGQCAGGGQA